MSINDISKKTEEAIGNIVLDDNGNAMLKYDYVLGHKESLCEQILNKGLTFIFGTSDEIKQEMYKNNDLYDMSKGNGIDTALYLTTSCVLCSISLETSNKAIQYLGVVDLTLRTIPIIGMAIRDLIKTKTTIMDHQIYPGIVGSIRQIVQDYNK